MYTNCTAYTNCTEILGGLEGVVYLEPERDSDRPGRTIRDVRMLLVCVALYAIAVLWKGIEVLWKGVVVLWTGVAVLWKGVAPYAISADRLCARGALKPEQKQRRCGAKRSVLIVFLVPSSLFCFFFLSFLSFFF